MPDYVGGNRLTLLRNGGQYFPALVAAIDAARIEVFLETYIFSGDETGSLVADALARAAARGVATHLLIDGYGAHDFAPRFRRMLAQANVELRVFRPDVSPWPPWRQRMRLRRMHRKVASIDGAVAFVGGINVIDDVDVDPAAPPRFDFAVRVEGPLAPRVRAEALRLWTRVSWATLGGRWPGLEMLRRRAAARTLPAPPAGAGGQRAALVVRDNLGHRRDIEEAYLELIGAAREEILIANAYFFPGHRFRRALESAAQRGVSVELLLQGKSDHPLQHDASRALYRPLLHAGVRIAEYARSELHAKVAVVDRRFASVGSSNIDPLSLMLAREANVFVDDAAFAAELRASLRQALAEGGRRVPRDAAHMPLLLRLRVWLSYRIARLLLAFWRFDPER
ncbi:MAG TPA: cardiolipin synthase ClsB [Burkholderiales bacterium]|nr:cardiolipin synthase ClsB [Burkholderiales bacterium]